MYFKLGYTADLLSLDAMMRQTNYSITHACEKNAEL